MMASENSQRKINDYLETTAYNGGSTNAFAQDSFTQDSFATDVLNTQSNQDSSDAIEIKGDINGELREVEDIWHKLTPRLRSIVGNGDFKAWIAPLALYRVSDTNVYFNSQSSIARSRIRTEYLHHIQSVWNDFDAKHRRVIIDFHSHSHDTHQESHGENNIEIFAENAKSIRPNNIGTTSNDTNSLTNEIFEPIDLNHCPKTFENFEKGSSNQIAIAVAKRIACELGGGEVIYFHGLNGVGKTHIMGAIAHHSLCANNSRRVISITAQRFLNLFQNALRDKQLAPFKEGLRSADLLLVDDIQMICGKNATQDEFFQTIMDLINAGKTVVCTADVPPDALVGLTARMQGILMGGFNVRIEEPDYDLRKKIAMRKACEFAIKRPDFQPPQEAFDILAARVTGTGRSIEGAIKQIFASSALIGEEATMEVVLDTIGDRFKAPAKTVPVENIKKKVAQHFDISLDDLIGARRHISVARPRQIAMYFCKKFTKRSYPDIAARMGGRDHTTVMHAVKRIEELANKDAKFASELQIIANKILS